MAYKLRPHQLKACQRTYTGWQQYDSVLNVLPTGSGKSLCIAAIAESWNGNGYGDDPLGDRVLILAHRDELIWQLAESYAKWTGETPGIEKGELTTNEDDQMFERPRVVISSVQSMAQTNRRNRFKPSEWGCVIIDECHHAVAPTYTETLDYFCSGGAKVAGFTATADRADEVSLGQVFDTVSYRYDILDAIKDGWLCPIKQVLVNVESLSFEGCATSNGDLSATDIGRIISEEKVLHEMAKPALELSGDRQTIIFVPTVDTGIELEAILNRYKPGCAVSVSGKTEESERRAKVSAYRDGDVQYLVNCALLLEGFDAPKTSCIIMFRATKSRALYSQAIGRGLRGGHNAPIEGKTDCLVIDFAGNSRHKLVTSIDLLGGSLEDCVVDDANEKMREATIGGDEVDPLELITESTDIADALRSKQREEIIAKQMKSRKKEIDPFDLLDVPDRKMPGYYTAKMATPGQMKFLAENGYETKNKMTYWNAHRLCEEMSRRKEEGLCTIKQARLLARFGHSTDLTKDQASTTLDRLFKKDADGKSGKPWANMTGSDWKKFNAAKTERKRKEQEAIQKEAEKLALLEKNKNKEFEF